MPLNCWLSCITMPMISGGRRVGEHISSMVDMWLSDCWARSSARISSMSSSTDPEARSRRRATQGFVKRCSLKFIDYTGVVPFRASSSHCLVMSRYLGDSGQTGSRISCRIAGQMARPRRMGQPSLVPRICSMPSTWDNSKPTVTANWLTVPKPPRRFSGAISEMYMGTSEVLRPSNQIHAPISKYLNLLVYNNHSPQLTPIINRPRNNIS